MYLYNHYYITTPSTTTSSTVSIHFIKKSTTDMQHFCLGSHNRKLPPPVEGKFICTQEVGLHNSNFDKISLINNFWPPAILCPVPTLQHHKSFLVFVWLGRTTWSQDNPTNPFSMSGRFSQGKAKTFHTKQIYRWTGVSKFLWDCSLPVQCLPWPLLLLALTWQLQFKSRSLFGRLEQVA